ncbi:MAG: peptide transporter permease [Acidimicrobiaceae bacterium]|nr:peptide transporter permease [Acidimicrobiaceae bacterium]
MSLATVSIPQRRVAPLRAFISLPRSLLAAIAVLVPFAVMAAIPSVLAPYSPSATIGTPLSGPSARYWLGTDEIGRDVLSRVIYSAQSDVVISLAATAIAFAVGSIVGIFLGYRGGVVDAAGTRVVDVMLAFPAIVLALFLIAIFGHGELVEIVAIAAVMMPSMARFARGTSLLLRNRAYIESSEILRASRAYVMRRHLLPNALRSLLVAASVLGASAVLISASLSYLGLGVTPPTPSWGTMLFNAFQNVFQAPLYGIAPGVFITVLAYGYMLLGRGLGDLQGRTGRQERAFRTSSMARV